MILNILRGKKIKNERKYLTILVPRSLKYYTKIVSVLSIRYRGGEIICESMKFV